MFSWSWENGDALNYCSCHPGSCVILGKITGKKLHSLGTLVAAALAQPRGCVSAREGLGTPGAPVASSGTASCLLMRPRARCKGRHGQGGR